MPVIEWITEIRAPLSVVFDTARAVEVHLEGMGLSVQQITAGKKEGHLEVDDWFTTRYSYSWRKSEVTLLMTEFEKPYSFQWEMVQGPLRQMMLSCIFEPGSDFTRMRSTITFEAPFGIVGKWLEKIYWRRIFIRRGHAMTDVIKGIAEALPLGD